ncbi:MAG: thioesterase [Planctomycetales bacterium]|nr:thioesterase [Planctomycetales bacterium]
MPLSNQWFTRTAHPPTASLRLLCFSYAGGGSAIFHRWKRVLPESWEVVVAKLPGREDRLNDPCFEDLLDLVRELTEQWQAGDDRRLPFALFGHSLGGALAFEFARRMQSIYGRMPLTTFVSSCRAPRRPPQSPLLHPLSDGDLIAQLLHRYGQFETSPGELELMKMLADTIRSDIKMLETYDYPELGPLQSPLVVCGGVDDPSVTRVVLEDWRQEAGDRFTLRMFPGGHFYLREQETALTRLIKSKLESVIA